MGIMVTLNNAPHNNDRSIPLDEALRLLRSPQRITFIDTRNRKAFVNEHPVFSVNVPSDCVELQVQQLFGNESGIALIIGDNQTLTYWVASVIEEITRLTPRIIEGGFIAWKDHQLPTWGGEYTPSKAFGEWVEQTGKVKNIMPTDAIQAQPDYQFDVRPFSEYQKFSLPNSIHCPTGQLGSLSVSNCSIYVHCAGRTRGIIAAQTLADQDFNASIHCITGGTQGWELAGGVRSFNNHQTSNPLQCKETMAMHAKHLIEKFNLPIATCDHEIHWATSATSVRMITVSEDPTTPQAISPTTLIQSTDQYLGTHNMPILIQGPNQLDCAVSTLWLRRMGWDAWLRDDYVPEPVMAEQIRATSPEWTDEWMRAKRFIDIRSSAAFKASRLNGSHWIPRSQFDETAKLDQCLFVCDDQQITQTKKLAKALNLIDPIFIAWETIPEELIDTSTIDFQTYPVDQALFFPDRHQGDLEHAKGYLDWEHSLLPTLRDHGGIPWKSINESLDQPKSHLTTFYQKVHL